MKLLQNPWAVGLLGLAGLAVLGFNLGGPIYRKRAAQKAAPAAARPLPSSATEPAGSPPPAAASLSVAAPAGASQIDRAHFVGRMENWMVAPPTDPFTVPPAPAPELPKGPTAAEVLKLQGTWRQTGGFVAVINRSALVEGEAVEGFTVHRIEADRVLVTGPHGLEEIFFAGDPGTAALAAAPPVSRQASLTLKP